MTTMIQVERDTEGLHTALVGLFEEAFQQSAIEEASRAADKEQRQRMLDGIPARQLSPGYYVRAEYILDLGRAIETGITYSAEILTREDVRGLQMLERARNEFEREHPACGGCGVRQDNRFSLRCRGCGVKFMRGGTD